MISTVQVQLLTPDNLLKLGLYCVKNKKSPGYQLKREWYVKWYPKGLRIALATVPEEGPKGFIEWIPGEYAWRPVKANNWLFIHCIAVYRKDDRRSGIGSALIERCIEEAKNTGKHGVCVMTSSGAWMAEADIFNRNGFQKADSRGRFELQYFALDNTAPLPKLINWEKHCAQLEGWHLEYANQCPWHEKSATDLSRIALEKGIDLHVHLLDTPKKAQSSSSGFGTFAIVRNGRLLADHYISGTRFKNILKAEMT